MRNIKAFVYRLFGRLPCGHPINRIVGVEFTYASWYECGVCGVQIDPELLH